MTAGEILDPLKPLLLRVNGNGDEENAEEKEDVSEALEKLWPNETKLGEENIDAVAGLFGKLAIEVTAVMAVAPPAGREIEEPDKK